MSNEPKEIDCINGCINGYIPFTNIEDNHPDECRTCGGTGNNLAYRSGVVRGCGKIAGSLTKAETAKVFGDTP